MPGQDPRHLIKQRPWGEEELDQGLGSVAERGVVDDGGKALERADIAQAIDPAFDGGRGERDVASDVVVGASPVLDEQRKNLSVCGVHTVIYCTDRVCFGIDSRFLRRYYS